MIGHFPDGVSVFVIYALLIKFSFQLNFIFLRFFDSSWKAHVAVENFLLPNQTSFCY